VPVAERAALLACLGARAGEALLVEPDGAARWLPCDLTTAGLRLLVVEPGLPPCAPAGAAAGALPGSAGSRCAPAGSGAGAAGDLVDLAACRLRAGHPAGLGELLTDAYRQARLLAGDDPAGLGAAVEAAVAAGALGAGLAGDPARPALVALLPVAELAAVRAAVRAALPAGPHPARFLTATPVGRLVVATAFG
jgi:galactokinase